MDAVRAEARIARIRLTITAEPSRGGHAPQNYPWCAYYSGGDDGGGTNCGFITFEQEIGGEVTQQR